MVEGTDCETKAALLPPNETDAAMSDRTMAARCVFMVCGGLMLLLRRENLKGFLTEMSGADGIGPCLRDGAKHEEGEDEDDVDA